MRRPDRAEVTAAIVVWLQARERAERCRSVSASLAQAAEYGGPIHAQPASPPCPASGLVDAERPVALLTDAERALLVERYWRDFRMVAVDRELAPGVRLTYLKACWQADEVVARRLGMGTAALRKRLQEVRGMVALGLLVLRGYRPGPCDGCGQHATLPDEVLCPRCRMRVREGGGS
jgi:hypothetical protein